MDSQPTTLDGETALVAAYELDGHGAGELLSVRALREAWPDSQRTLWMHLDFRHDDVGQYLNELAHLDEAAIEALLEEDTRPRVAKFRDGVVSTLRGINLNPGAAPEDLISLRIWIAPKRLITLRRRPLRSVSEVRESLDKGEGALSIPDLLAWLTESLVDKVGDVAHQIDDGLGELEEDQLSDREIDPDDLSRHRRSLVTLRRFMGPQRDCLEQIAHGPDWFDEDTQVSIRESANQLSRYVEDFHAMQERALILQEHLLSEHNERLNQRMYMLAIVTTVFLPLSFLTGLLGINVGGIPGSDSPYGFAIFLLITVIVGGWVMLVLKRKRWW